MAAFGLVAVGAVGWSVMRSLGIGPAATLVARGVISSAAVAPTTPLLSPEAARRFDQRFAEIREMSRELIGAPWVTEGPGEESVVGALA